MNLKDADQVLRDASRSRPTDPASRPIDLYSVTEAALMTKTNPFTIWKWIREGRITAYGFKGGLKVSLAEILPRYDPNANQ
jgi:hypothetical protein